jgi:hypothetical protein
MRRTLLRAHGCLLAVLAIGATGGCPGEKECVPPMATADDLQVVFQRSCALSSSCHVADGQAANLDLSSVAATCQGLDGVASCENPSVLRVVDGHPEESYFYRKLTCENEDCTKELGVPDADCPGEPTPDGPANQRMPARSPPLPDCELEAIAEWITLGLPGCPDP